MTAEPITARALAEALRAVRRDARMFAAAEVNALRSRIETLEDAHRMQAPHTHLATWADQMAHRLDPSDQEGAEA
jgi:hypothetical protein